MSDAFDVVRCERAPEGWRVDGRAYSDVAVDDSLACLACGAAMPVLAITTYRRPVDVLAGTWTGTLVLGVACDHVPAGTLPHA